MILNGGGAMARYDYFAQFFSPKSVMLRYVNVIYFVLLVNKGVLYR